MTDLTKEQILKRLASGTVIRDWSAVGALARSHINLLLRDQFLQGYTDQSFIAPMSSQFDLDEGGELRGEFRNLVFGPPQLSFEDATLLSAVTTVRMSILSGDYVQHAHLPGSPPILLRAYSVDEAMGYAVSAQVELKLQQSASGQYTQLMLALSDARPDTLECELGTTPYASKQIGQAVFSHWLEQPGYRQVYILAQFDREDYASMSPMGIKVLTQMAPWGGKTDKASKDKAASEGDGAVLLLMQTRSHLLPGTLPQPGHDFPFLLPGTAAAGAEYSCTVLLDPVNEGKRAEPLTQVLRPVRMPNAHRYTYSAGDKFVPADVVGFGHISPTEGTCRVEPGIKSIVAQETLPFKLEGSTPAEGWNTTNIRSTAASGDITDAGVYTSRDADAFTADSQISLVTGRYGSDGDQQRAALLIEHVRPVQISPRVMTTGANGVPIQLAASSVDGGTLRWEKVDTPQSLRASRGPQRAGNHEKHDLTGAYSADLGKLEDLGNGKARFTPAKIEQDTPEILFQVIRATDTRSGAFADATVVIVTRPQYFSVDPFYVADYKPNGTVPFSVKGTPPGLTWHWFGEGEIGQDGIYTPPLAAKLPVTVVMADWQNLNSGYAIIEHRPVVLASPATSGWDDLAVFSIELLSPGVCFANGMQQIEVLITIKTKVDGLGVSPPISDTELASLKLFNTEGGKVIEFLPAGEEGLEPDDPSKPGTWAVSKDRNRVGTRPGATQGETLPMDASTRTKHLFLLTNSVGTLFVGAQFTGDDRIPYKSTSYNDGNSKVKVTGEAPPEKYTEDAYTFKRIPVKGWEGENTEDFDKTDDTTDYWVLAGAKSDEFKTLSFLRLKFDDDNKVSMIRWESNQRKEKYCSFTSFAFTPLKPAVMQYPQNAENPEDPEKYLVYDGLLQALVKAQVGDPDFLDTELVESAKPGRGDVCFALHRVSNLPLFYDSEKDKREKWRAPLERPLLFRLMDQFGNWHRLKVDFHLASGVKGSRDKLSFSVR
ncbi:hypothetical protein V0R39_22915 [Pseudomonas inefficax]|uniref:hypothetical protein n=1 Tax=Pseudomonas asiatica TaxID=2219225 RepID=UPI0025A3D04C|nr:hypothetical protein [Pseudomonas asiatica]MEE1903945.1 hypothetical protein [Pseudomonas inefficax]MEE1909521.1 hypothetical protein [Pseudomonas inefficax]MEE1987334.1 hypothetical protein [Pseudomonas inefficax]WJN51724.1 hypothetical protein QUR91_07905 [Pseudomonas asiatica]